MAAEVIQSYETVIRRVDELLTFLESINIEPALSSYLESDYLAAHEFYEKFQRSGSTANDEPGRAALGGLHELYKWIWAAKRSAEFEKIHGHLELLVQSIPRINGAVSLISPVTGKQDDKSNKFVEAIVGLFAVAHGTSVELDDPIRSSGGGNPDAIFTFRGARISVACKTLRTSKPGTIFGNLSSAAKQISRADCERGYILFNSMNILEHAAISSCIYDTYLEPISVLIEGVKEKYRSVLAEYSEELKQIFLEHPKVSPNVITTVHSVTKIRSLAGYMSTSLKTTLLTNFGSDDEVGEADMAFPEAFNDFLHNRQEHLKE